jgi:hypothetical protein
MSRLALYPLGVAVWAAVVSLLAAVAVVETVRRAVTR